MIHEQYSAYFAYTKERNRYPITFDYVKRYLEKNPEATTEEVYTHFHEGSW